MNTYLDLLLTNREVDSSSSEESINEYRNRQYGGFDTETKKTIKTKPTGSYPPLTLSSKKDIQIKKTNLRSFEKGDHHAVSITKIMEDNRNEEIEPFFEL